MSSSDTIPKCPVNEFYQVRPVANKGFGCVALKPLKQGARILEEKPLLVIHDTQYLLSEIEGEYNKLTAEDQRLYFSLHSNHGQDPRRWPTSIHPTVPALERQRILEQHAARTGEKASVTSIFQTNCMEMGAGAAVFAYSSRFNHCCNPNASFSWNAAIGKETIHIIQDVAEGEEITLSYCDMTHDKKLRSWSLKHYNFVCDCPACGDESVAENTFARESAARRFRLSELDQETDKFRGKNLHDGLQQENFIAKLLEMAALHQAEGDYTVRLAGVLVDVALVCEANGDYKMALEAAVMAQEVKVMSQGEDSEGHEGFVEVVQRVKAKLAEEEE